MDPILRIPCANSFPYSPVGREVGRGCIRAAVKGQSPPLRWQRCPQLDATLSELPNPHPSPRGERGVASLEAQALHGSPSPLGRGSSGACGRPARRHIPRAGRRRREIYADAEKRVHGGGAFPRLCARYPQIALRKADEGLDEESGCHGPCWPTPCTASEIRYPRWGPDRLLRAWR